MQRIRSGPGKPLNEPFVDVREPGMSQVVAEVVKVRPDQISTDRLTHRGHVGKGFVSGRYPQSMQDPTVASVSGEPRRVALATKRCYLDQQSLELEQGVTIGSLLCAHNADAARKSGLTWSFLSAPSENTATSAPIRSVAARWNSNISNRS